MTVESTIALTIAIFVLGMTPGPGLFAIVARALATGFAPTLAFIFGIIAGDLLYIVLSALGLSVLATQYADLFGVIKIVGGLYLIYLGVQMWRSGKDADDLLTPKAERRGGRRFLSGFSLTLGNPKVVVFYAAFLPAFMDLSVLGMWDLVLVGAVVSVTLFSVFAGYAFMAARARRVFKSQRAVKNLHRGAGALMVGAGGAVAASS